MLPIALGQATRLVEYLADGHKGYRALIHLGRTTTTDDGEGEIVSNAPLPNLDTAAIEEVLGRFRGTIMQVPPIYSALHHQGQRLYKLARSGQAPELAPRPISIYRLELLAWQPPQLEVELSCGKGTYIRALARDIGAELGCGAYLAQLSRSFVGPFHLAEAVLLTELRPANLAAQIQPPALAVADWTVVPVDASAASALRNGQMIAAAGDAARARAEDGEGTLVALLERVETHWRPIKVFTWS